MKKKARFVVKMMLFILLTSIAVVCAYIVLSLLQLKKIYPTEESQFKWPYYLYINEEVKKKALDGQKVHILVLPNNTGTVSEDITRDDIMAKVTAVLGKTMYGDLNTIILVPVFPRPGYHPLIYTHALDRDVLTTDITELKRLDLQLLAMIDDVRETYEKDHWNIDDKVLMWGFSASGMFVNRFTMMHPDRVLAASVGSPGGWPIVPSKTWEGKRLRYPIGIDDLDELTGESANLEEYKKIPQLFFLGGEDCNDSVPYGDSYEDKDRELINNLFGTTPVERWSIAEKIYESIGANVKFIIYERVGHRPTLKSFKETKDLFKSVIAKSIS